MTDLPKHPIFVHFPLALSLLIPIYLFGFITFKQKFDTHFMRGLGLGLQTMMLLSCLAAFISGAIDRPLSAAPLATLDLHEHWALGLTVSTVPPLITMGLFFFAPTKTRSYQLWIDILTLGLSLVTLYLSIQTGHIGGVITYG